MTRLPTPGGDDGTWGNILNQFLDVSHNSDGSLKSSAVTIAGAASDNSVVHNSGNETIGGVKTFSSSPVVPTPTTSTQAANKTYVDSTVSAGAPDASSTAKGILKLTNDLGGTADLPTVPGLANKADKATAISAGTGLTGGGDLSANRTLTVSYGTAAGTAAQGNDSRITGAEQIANKGAASGYAPLDSGSKVPIANIPTGTSSSTVALGNDSRVTGAIQSSIATTKGDLLAATAASTVTRQSVGSDGQVLTADSTQTTGIKWNTPASSLPPTGTAGGDLSGTYPNPTVAKVNGVAVSGTAGANLVLTATSSNAASWQASPSVGFVTPTMVSDAISLADGALAPASHSLASATATFSFADVGKTLVIAGAAASSGPLVTTISGFTDSHHVTLTAAATTECDGNNFFYGTDNATAFATASSSAVSTKVPLHIPGGNFLVTSLPTVTSGIVWQGVNQNSSALYFAGTGDAIAGVDLSYATLRDFTLNGPGQGQGTGNGINFSISAHPANFWLTFERLFVNGFGADGVSLSTPIISTLTQVTSEHNGRHGINITGNGGGDATSCTLTSCFPAGNWGAGYYFKQVAYSTINGGAADSNGTAYKLDTCVGISANGCGAEEPFDFSAHQAGFVGYAWWIVNSRATINSPYMIGNIGTAFYITSGAPLVTINDLFEGSAGSGNTASLKVDTGSTVIVNGYSVVTAMSLASGTTTLMPDQINTNTTNIATNTAAITALQGSAGSYTANTLTSGENTEERSTCASAVSLGGSQSLRLSFFTAKKTGTYTQLKTVSSTTAAGATPTLCKIGLFSVDGSDNGTLVAVTANNIGFWGAINTAYSAGTITASITSTLAAGSQNVTFGSITTLNVASTTGFAASGTVVVPLTSNLTGILAYTGTTSTSFTGCTVVAGSGTTANSAASVYQGASYSITAGNRYCYALLVVTAAAIPNVPGASMAGSAAANAIMLAHPARAASLASQSDMPPSFLWGNLGGVASIMYGELVP